MMAGVTTLRLLAAAPLLLLAACGGGGEPATVAGMRLMDGSRVEVVVESGACADPGSVELEESRTEVTVAATTVATDGDCTDEVVLEATRVRLTSPIGDRAVVDASTGDEVPYVVCADEPDDSLCDV